MRESSLAIVAWPSQNAVAVTLKRPSTEATASLVHTDPAVVESTGGLTAESGHEDVRVDAEATDVSGRLDEACGVKSADDGRRRSFTVTGKGDVGKDESVVT